MGRKNKLSNLDKVSKVMNCNKNSTWLDQEVKGCEFKDKRLLKRFKGLLEQMWDGVGETIPFACQDWASTKAAYRFFSNNRVNEKEILDGHFKSTKERFAKAKGMILVLQDTTDLGSITILDITDRSMI